MNLVGSRGPLTETPRPRNALSAPSGRSRVCLSCAEKSKRPETPQAVYPCTIGRDGGIRTHDPLTPSQKKAGNSGQRETAAPFFPKQFYALGQHQNAVSRYRLSAI